MSRLNVTSSQELKNKTALKEDKLFTVILSKTPLEIEKYFDNNLSDLSGMDSAQIDTYIDDNINSLAEAKNALKVLARDSAFMSSHLKLLVKAMGVLVKKV